MTKIFARSITTDGAVDLPSSLDDFQVIHAEDDMIIAIGNDPGTGIPAIFINSEMPALVLNGGSGGFDLLSSAFPEPYEPARIRKEKMPL